MLMRAGLVESLGNPLPYRTGHALGQLGLCFHAHGAKPEGDGLGGDSPRQLKTSALQSPSILTESRLVTLQGAA